jgi:1,4-dihydroxy-2-naphthoate octaprenyltransferase
MGSTFVLNQIADKESDKVNQKLFIISNSYISNKAAVIEVIILISIALIIGLYLQTQVFLLYIAFTFFTGFLYNFKPAELKNRPWGSLFANAIMGWLAFAIGWSVNQLISLELIIDSLPYLLFNTALYLFTTLPDINGDKSTEKKTLAVKYGIKSVILAAFFLFGIGLLIAVILNDYQAMFFYILSIPFFIHTIISFDIIHTIKSTKYGILFFALSICFKMPLYFIIMLLGFFATKVYFRYRFNLNYPNFSGQ